jgi:ABC-type transporter Mla MlaB component
VQRKLSVLVEVDLDGRYVRVSVTGGLTRTNQQGLHPVLRRARTTLPAARVSVDLSCVHELEPAALDLLREAVEHDEDLGEDLEILAPEAELAEPAAAALDARRRLRAKVLHRRCEGLPVPPPGPELHPAS